MAWGDGKDEKWRTEVGSAPSKAKREADWGLAAVKSPTDKHWSNVRDHLGKLLNAPFELFRREQKPLGRLLDDPDKFFAKEQRAEDKFFRGHAKHLGNLYATDEHFRSDAKHLDKLLGGGRYTYEIRKRISGDPAIASRFIGPARLLLGQLKEDMEHNSLQQGVRRRVIPVNERVEIGSGFAQLHGPVAIVAASSHGQSEIYIDVTGVMIATPSVPAYQPFLRIFLVSSRDDLDGIAVPAVVGRQNVFESPDDPENEFLIKENYYKHVEYVLLPAPLAGERVEQVKAGTYAFGERAYYSYGTTTNCLYEIHYVHGGRLYPTLELSPTEILGLAIAASGDYPPSLQEHIKIALRVGNDPLSGNAEPYSIFVADPSADALQAKTAAMDEWGCFKIVASGTQEEIAETGGIADVKMVIDLGRPTVRYVIPLSIQSLSHEGHEFSGTPGAVLVNIRDGVIFRTDDYVIPPAFESGFNSDIQAAPHAFLLAESTFGTAPSPVNPRDYRGTYYFHPNSRYQTEESLPAMT